MTEIGENHVLDRLNYHLVCHGSSETILLPIFVATNIRYEELSSIVLHALQPGQRPVIGREFSLVKRYTPGQMDWCEMVFKPSGPAIKFTVDKFVWTQHGIRRLPQ